MEIVTAGKCPEFARLERKWEEEKEEGENHINGMIVSGLTWSVMLNACVYAIKIWKAIALLFLMAKKGDGKSRCWVIESDLKERIEDD